MRIAALYDVHGNLPALEAVLAEIADEPVDEVVVGGGVRVVNAGSVGMPFGEPGAYWLRLGPGVEPRRTAYDLTAAAERIRATEYPDAEPFAARSVLAPPSEEEMLELFRGAELGRPEERAVRR